MLPWPPLSRSINEGFLDQGLEELQSRDYQVLISQQPLNGQMLECGYSLEAHLEEVRSSDPDTGAGDTYLFSAGSGGDSKRL